MDRLACEPVGHLNSKRTGRTLIVGLLSEKAQSGLYKSIESLFTGEVGCIASYTCPIESCRINGVMARLALHWSQSATHIVFNAPKLLWVVRPRHHIKVRSDRGKSVRVCLIEVLLYPLFIDLVATAVSWKRVHIACWFLKLSEVLIGIVQKQVLVVNMVTTQ